MKRLIKFSAMVILTLTAYSLIPVVALYLSKDAISYTNEEAAKKLKANAGEYFAFIVFGDNHAGLVLNDSSTLKMARHINREDRFKKMPIDFALITGDVTYKGSRWDFRSFNNIRSMIRRPILSAIGNHDDDDDKGQTTGYFKEYIGKKEFSFANRNSYFIVIDNSTGNLSEPQFSSLEEELKKSQSYKHRFVIAHKPPFSPYQQSWYRPELGPWSYRFMKLCERYKVDMVFSGHEHIFKSQTFGGVDYIVSGGGGMITQVPKSDGGFLHYVVVRVRGDYVDYEVRKVSPPFWVYLVYYIWKDALYFLKGVVL